MHGLVALMEIQASRARARTGPRGEPILLLEQDRSRWDQLLIRRGLTALERGRALGGVPGPYLLQAEIAACHARAKVADETDWRRIAALYSVLAVVQPSPIVELNRAVAVAMAFGPGEGLKLVDALLDDKALARYHLLPSVRGDTSCSSWDGWTRPAWSSSGRPGSREMPANRRCFWTGPGPARKKIDRTDDRMSIGAAPGRRPGMDAAIVIAALTLLAPLCTFATCRPSRVTGARRIGPWVLGERIGEGGMGVVYRARHVGLDRVCALKLLEGRASPDKLARFEREAHLTRELAHPSTVRVFDSGRTPDGGAYYAMELLEGETLRELVEREGALAPERVIEIMAAICSALEAVHASGLIHRDISPGTTSSSAALRTAPRS